MSTRLENIHRIRSFLRSPYPNAPAFHNILQQSLSDEMDVLNQLSNTGKPWSTLTYDMQYFPNQGLPIQLNVQGLGKILFVTRVINSPYIHELPVPIDNWDEQQYGTIWMQMYSLYGVPWNLNHTIERISFNRTGATNQQYWANIQPQPQQSGTYRIRYVPGNVDDNASLSTTTLLPEHHELIQLRSALSLLADSEWFEDEAQNDKRRLLLRDKFMYMLQRKEEIFKEYIAQLVKGRTVDLESWNENSY